MHRTCLLFTLTLLLGFTIAFCLMAADPIPTPNGPPPIPMHVILRGDKLFLQQVMFVQQPETRTRTVEVNGKRQDQPYTVMTMSAQFMVTSLPQDAFMVFTVTGKRLSKEEVAATLAQESEVLISPAGKLLDPSYLPLFRADAIIVYTNPNKMFGQDYGPPTPNNAPAPQPPPTFTNKDLPKGLGPRPGLLRKVGSQLVLTQYDWDMINEWKTTTVVEKEAPDSEPVPVSKHVPTMHWVPRPEDKVLKTGDFEALDVQGQEMPGALDSISTNPTAVFIQSADEEFDPSRFRLCRSGVIVLRGDFPQPDYASKYSAPAAPSECFASVQEGKLRVLRTVVENAMVKVPVKGPQPDGAGSAKFIDKVVIHSKFVPQYYPLNEVQYREVTGTSLTAKSVSDRLAVNTPVLVALDDEPVDASYVACTKPDTIVLTLPDTTSDQAPANAGKQQAPASGPPPQFAKIQSLGDKLVLSVPRTTSGYFPAQLAGPGDAPAKPQLFTHWDSRILAAGDFRVFDAKGQPIDSTRFSKEAARPVIALFSATGKKLDPVWFSIYDPRTIVVYVRPEAMERGYHHRGGMIVAPPAPTENVPPST